MSSSYMGDFLCIKQEQTKPSKHFKSSSQGIGVRPLFQDTRGDPGYLRAHLDMIPETPTFYSILRFLTTPMNHKYNVWILILY